MIFGWLPEGHEYTDGEEIPRIQQADFENAQSDYIRILVITYDSSSAYNYNSEAGTSTGVSFGGFSGQLVKEGGQISLFWADNQQHKFVSIVATDLPQEEFLQLARG